MRWKVGRPGGGIGRRNGFRSHWEKFPVRVQIPARALYIKKMKEIFPSKFEKEIKEIKEKIKQIEGSYYKEKKVPPQRKEILKQEIFKIKKEVPKEPEKEKNQFYQKELNYFLRQAKENGVFETAKKIQKTKNPYLIDAFHDKIIEEIEKRESST